MKRFSLKAGQKVWVNIKTDKLDRKIAEIEGFRACGICYKDHNVRWHHYSNGLFYGFGYHTDGFAIVTKKRWHYIPAFLAEKLRLSIPTNLSIKLHLEK